ncbi:MAG TPA: hypothetical protein VLF91_05420 [Candidatus Saccharimonadales bacterium]|nr:hypothetical protein [Candidatus Saccharimonadales bacterium]
MSDKFESAANTPETIETLQALREVYGRFQHEAIEQPDAAWDDLTTTLGHTWPHKIHSYTSLTGGRVIDVSWAFQHGLPDDPLDNRGLLHGNWGATYLHSTVAVNKLDEGEAVARAVYELATLSSYSRWRRPAEALLGITVDWDQDQKRYRYPKDPLVSEITERLAKHMDHVETTEYEEPRDDFYPTRVHKPNFQERTLIAQQLRRLAFLDTQADDGALQQLASLTDGIAEELADQSSGETDARIITSEAISRLLVRRYLQPILSRDQKLYDLTNMLHDPATIPVYMYRSVSHSR